MVLDTIKQFKWFDLFILILLFRICYVALKTGFPTEVFKLLGTIFATLLSLHYYTIISDFLNARFSITAVPLEFMDFIIFAILAEMGYFTFSMLRFAFLRVVKVEAISLLNRWGGLAVGLMRAGLLIGLLTYGATISSVKYLKSSVENSYFGKYTFEISPSLYRNFWDGFISKFLPDSKANKIVEETINNFGRK